MSERISAESCAQLWVAALATYYRDARSGLRYGTKCADEGEALEDLTGSQTLLANLCGPLGADVDVVAEIIMRALNIEPG